MRQFDEAPVFQIDTLVCPHHSDQDPAQSDPLLRALATESSAPWQDVEQKRRPLLSLLRAWRSEPKPSRPRDHVSYWDTSETERASRERTQCSVRIVYGPACYSEEVISLSRERLLAIGRDQDAPHLCVEDKTMSRRHATIHWDRDIQSFKIIDEGSHNGVYVNGTRVTSAPLCPDDVIRMGETLLVFGITELENGSQNDGALAHGSQPPLLPLLATLARSPQNRLTADAAEALLLGQFHSNSETTERLVRRLDSLHPAEESIDLLALNRVEPNLVSDLNDARRKKSSRERDSLRKGARGWRKWLGLK